MISHAHKFIFIHIPKTAGDSIEREFGAWKLKNKEKCLVGMHKILNKPIHHFTIDELKKHDLISNNSFDYFKFCFVRNPYSRIVSAWKYLKKQSWTKVSEDMSLKKFILQFQNYCHVRPQYNWTHTNEMKVVDFIGRFENLQQDFDFVCNKIGIPQRELPHKNKTKHKHYTEYYDDETRRIVAEKYSKDIEFFGYKFGD